MALSIINKVASYLERLEATSPLCTALGTEFSYGSNLFIIAEPDVDATNLVTVIPYGGLPPNTQDKNKQEGGFQISIKTRSRARGASVPHISR